MLLKLAIIFLFYMITFKYHVISQEYYIEKIIGIAFVRVEAGSFMMGSNFAENVSEEEKRFFIDELPIHKVNITKSIWVSETEITVGQFRKFIDETNYITDAEKSGESLGKYQIDLDAEGVYHGQWVNGVGLNWKTPGWEITENHPVVHVSFNDAIAFCDWLSSKMENKYRLLTEAEWEYTAGGSSHTIYSWGNNLPDQLKGGNIADILFLEKFPEWKYPVLKTYNDRFVYTSPVKSYEQNDFKLYDMSGNVWEWCLDFYNLNYYKNSQLDDPKGPENESEHILRGGGFDWELPYLRVAKRRHLLPNRTACNLGFRIAFE